MFAAMRVLTRVQVFLFRVPAAKNWKDRDIIQVRAWRRRKRVVSALSANRHRGLRPEPFTARPHGPDVSAVFIHDTGPHKRATARRQKRAHGHKATRTPRLRHRSNENPAKS